MNKTDAQSPEFELIMERALQALHVVVECIKDMAKDNARLVSLCAGHGMVGSEMSRMLKNASASSKLLANGSLRSRDVSNRPATPKGMKPIPESKTKKKGGGKRKQ